MKNLVMLALFIFHFGIVALSQEKGLFIDPRDNKEYKTVLIGDQVWFAENLAFESKKGSWVYKKDSNNLNEYGRLYNWKTACKICPMGWRLPTIDDYKVLLKNLDVDDSLQYFNALIDGGISGFNAKLAGWYARMKYGQLNEHTDFWTSSVYQPFKGATKAPYRFSLYLFDKMVYWGNDFSNYAFSVRCIKEE